MWCPRSFGRIQWLGRQSSARRADDDSGPSPAEVLAPMVADGILSTGVSMQIDERTVGNVTVLDLKGTVVLNNGDVGLRDKINSLVHQDRLKILLNLGAVPYIDSAGLG